MKTIFTNTENSGTNEQNRFKLDLEDKLNLKNANKNMALANLSIITLGKILSQNTTTINLIFRPQLGVTLLIYLMVLILLMIFKIILNALFKNMQFK